MRLVIQVPLARAISLKIVQRVVQASVTVNNAVISKIGRGLLVLVGTAR